MSYDWSQFTTSGHRLVVTAVRASEQLAKAADRFLAAFDLSLAQFNILTVLSIRPDGIPQVELGNQLVVSRANVTGLVQRLAARKLCATVQDSSDGRVKRVHLTPAGRRLLDRIEEPYLRRIERLTSRLRNTDMDDASSLLEELVQGLKALEADAKGQQPRAARGGKARQRGRGR
jgi:MarR family 2-MHQ and catechol resistance regulon transcriptional repressor